MGTIIRDLGTLSADSASRRIHSYRSAHARIRNRPIAVIFSIIEGVLLRPLPFADPATVVALGHVADGADSNGAPKISASQVITLFP